MKARNKHTGVVVEFENNVQGGAWEPIEEPEKKKTTPKKKDKKEG